MPRTSVGNEAQGQAEGTSLRAGRREPQQDAEPLCAGRSNGGEGLRNRFGTCRTSREVSRTGRGTGTVSERTQKALRSAEPPTGHRKQSPLSSALGTRAETSGADGLSGKQGGRRYVPGRASRTATTLTATHGGSGQPTRQGSRDLTLEAPQEPARANGHRVGSQPRAFSAPPTRLRKPRERGLSSASGNIQLLCLI